MPMEWDSNQMLSIVGAAMVLYAFLALSFGRMDQKGLPYGILNCLGTFLLALSVLHPFNLGIFTVESVWSAASFWLCVKAVRRA